MTKRTKKHDLFLTFLYHLKAPQMDIIIYTPDKINGTDVVIVERATIEPVYEVMPLGGYGRKRTFGNNLWTEEQEDYNDSIGSLL